MKHATPVQYADLEPDLPIMILFKGGVQVGTVMRWSTTAEKKGRTCVRFRAREGKAVYSARLASIYHCDFATLDGSGAFVKAT